MQARQPEREESRREVTVQDAGALNRSRAWIDHHGHCATDSLQRLLQTPLHSLMTWLVVGIALALPAALFIGIETVQALGERWDGAPRISLFVDAGTATSVRDTAVTRLQQNPDVLDVQVITPEQALAEYEQVSGLQGVESLLGHNPMPTTLVVRFRNPLLPTDTLAGFADSWRQWPGISLVQVDLEWVQKLQQIMDLGYRLTMALGILFALGVILSVGNTIRLAIENRRSEIVVAKLVGATDAWVRRPFLYSGMWYGLVGALLSLGIVAAGLGLLAGPVEQLTRLYQSDFHPPGLTLMLAAGLLGTGAGLGLAGAWLAVARHLDEIQPR